MIAALLLQYLLVVAAFGTPATQPQFTVKKKQAIEQEAEELCKQSRSFWFSDPKQAVAYGKQAIKLAEQVNNQLILANAYNSTGAGFFNLGDYNTATDYFFKSLEIREDLHDTLALSASYNNIGNIYIRQQNYKKAHSFYQKSFWYAEQVRDSMAMSRSLNSLGYLYEQQNKPDSALVYLLQALPIKEKLKDKRSITVTLVNLGVAYQKKGDYQNALSYLHRSLELSQTTNNLHDLTYAYRGLAETYLGLKDYTKAIEYGRQSLKLAQDTYSKAEVRTSADVLHKIYKETGDFAHAYEYLNLYAIYTDSVNNEEITRQTTSFQVKYDTAEKEKENLKLLAEHELHESELQQRKLIQYATVVLLALSITVVVLAYMSKQRTKKLNKKLSRKNKEIHRFSQNIKQQKNALIRQARTLKEQKEELEQLNQLKSKLFSIVAHDLRGPLLSLKSLLQVLAMGMLPEEKLRHFAKTLEAEQQNTLWLVDNLLLWAKAQMEGQELVTEEINIQRLAEENLKLLMPQAERKGVTLHNLVPQQTIAFADTEMIKLVLRNLISNAIKFCNQGDFITIETMAIRHKQLRISVRDTGVGITEENKQHLFGMRSYSTLGTAREKGSGLGLPLCKDFVERNGGKIWVESEPGSGSIFSFTLPMTAPQQTLEASAQTAGLADAAV